MPTLLIKEDLANTYDSSADKAGENGQVLTLQLESYTDNTQHDQDRDIRTYHLSASSAGKLVQVLRRLFKEEGKELPECLNSLEAHYDPSHEVKLTRREKEVLNLIVKGFTNPQIADELFISPKTVDCHRTNLMRKLDVHNVAELVRYFLYE